jgi:hypothetical protein
MILDAQGQKLTFGTGVAITPPAGSAGGSFLYSGVATIGGQAVDAVVTLSALSSATLAAGAGSFDSTTNPYSGAVALTYLQPNLQIVTAGGSATFTIGFILGGSHGQIATPQGTPVTLRNVLVNAYDLDGSGGSAAGRQFVQFAGVGGYTLAGTTSISPSHVPATGTTFATTIGGNVTALPGTAAGDAIRVLASFDEVSTMTVAFGATGAAGISYFALDFGPGPAMTNPVVIDVNLAAGAVPLVTSEAGGSASFAVTLASAPRADVVVAFTGDDPTEGLLSARTLTFTAANWNIAQQVTVSGLEDLVADGDTGYTLRATASSAGDPRFNGVGALLDVVNRDNDGPAGPLPGGIDITDATDSGANDAVTRNPLPVLTFAAGPGLSVSVNGAAGQPLDPAQYSVSYAGGIYTITMLDADPVRAGIQPFGSFSGATPTLNVPNALDGSYTIRATDAGGVSADAGSFVIDTTAPTTTLSAIDISDDQGDPTDFVTGVAQQTISATLSAPLAQGEALLGSVDGGITWVDVSGFVTGLALAWSGPTATLLAGANQIRLKAVDLAGNEGPVASQAYEFDEPFYLVSAQGIDGRQAATPYSDPNADLDYAFFGSPGSEAVLGTRFNDFIALGGDGDAANGGDGNDIIDGGTGSNFLSGGSGRDVFFVDARNEQLTWTTIADWEVGEEVAVWGWREGVSRWSWADLPAGAAGYAGVTFEADMDGDLAVDTRITWSGLSAADLPRPVETSVGGLGLIWFV